MTYQKRGSRCLLCTFVFIFMSSCVSEEYEDIDLLGVDENEIGKVVSPIVNTTDWAAIPYSGIVKLGSWDLFKDVENEGWIWFCTGVLLANDTIATAKHCVNGGRQTSSLDNKEHVYRNFRDEPGKMEVHMKGPGDPWRTATLGALHSTKDLAIFFLDSPYPMYTDTGGLSTSKYVRFGQINSFKYPQEDWIEQWVACFGAGGVGDVRDPSNTTIIGDFFQIDGVDAEDYIFFINQPGYYGGNMTHGDSGGPCLVYNNTSLQYQYPLVGISRKIDRIQYTSSHVFVEEWE